MKALRYESSLSRLQAIKTAKTQRTLTPWPVTFEEFWLAVLGVPPADHHRHWISQVLGKSNEILYGVSGPHLSIRGPRDSAKSTFCALLAAWSIGLNPGIRIIYTSYSDAVALEQSRKIKRILASVAYQTIFPWVRIGKRDNESQWEIDKNWASLYPRPEDIRLSVTADLISTYTLYATGISGSVMGGRADLIISDDLTKSAQSIANKDVRQKIWENINSVLRPCLVNGGRWINVSMLARKGDINLTYLVPNYGFKVVTTPAILTKGDREYSYWPSRHPLASLREVRDRSPQMFALQYQNQEPGDADTGAIDPDWIVWTDKTEYTKYWLSIDLASGDGIKADYTAYTLTGLAKGNTLHVLSSILLKRRGNLSILKDLVGYKNDYPELTIVFESNAYQSSFKGDFNSFIRTPEGHNLATTRLIPVSSTKDIHDRVEAVSGLLENKFICFLNDGKGLSRLVGNLTSEIDTLEHDDDVSSFALNLTVARQYLVSRKTWQA